MARKKVKDAIIEVKDQRWHCRNRITLVFGSNDIEELDTYLYDKNDIKFQMVDFHQAKSKAIEEIIDNSIDEFYRGHVSSIKVTLSKDNKRVTVEDDGVGFPLDKIKVVYTEFRAGSKFKDEEVDSKGFLGRTLGQNGVGASATCLTSDYFKATVKHFNTKKERTVEFVDGALKIKEGKSKKYTGKSGVKVEVELSSEVYGDNTINYDLLRKRLKDLAYTNPGLLFTLNGEKFISKKGIVEIAQHIGTDVHQVIGEDAFIYETITPQKKNKAKAKYDLSIAYGFSKKNHDREKFISFVNSTPTYDGGFHHDRVRRIFINMVKEKLQREAKKNKVEIVDADIMTGAFFIINIIMPNPRFESQTKRKLVRDNSLEKSIQSLLDDNMGKFFRRNKEYLELILDRAKNRSKYDQLKEASKLAKKQRSKKIAKLLDANAKTKRHQCTLFICEGDSAIGGLRSARNKELQGGIALKGKPMNVTQSGLKDVLKNQEFQDIMGSVGLVLGEQVDINSLRYGTIVFLADSDVDGGHINTLLANFFYSYWPELFKQGMIQLAKAPLFEVISVGGKVYYAEDEAALTKLKKNKKLQIKTIHRNKGLGEMSDAAWDFVMAKEEYTVLEDPNSRDTKNSLEICFGKDAELRKKLLLSKGKK
jgi:DNA gyrase subunit B